jgi:hypothetical protein
MQSSACADVNIWSENEKERSCWRDGRGIGEIGEKMGEKMGGKMGEERCEGEKETAQVSSSVAVVVDVQWPQMRDAVSPSSRPCLYLAVPARFRFKHVSACSRPGGTADAGSCQVRRGDTCRRCFWGEIRPGTQALWGPQGLLQNS